VEVIADGPDHRFTGVQTHPNLHLDPVRVARLFRIALDGMLHRERGRTGPHRVIFMGERRPEQGHDPVAHHLVHGPFIAMDRIQHALQHRVEHLPGLLGVAISQ
jgi:hypothetical protein